MQIKSLYIHNYKSFYDTTIEFDKFNIIVAQNNAGKSNLIDVLEFINIALEYDIERAIKEKGGIDNIKNYKNDEEKIVIEISIQNSNKNLFQIISIGRDRVGVIFSAKGLIKIRLTISKSYYQLTIFLNIGFKITNYKKEHNNEDEKKLKKQRYKYSSFSLSKKTFINKSKNSLNKLFLNSIKNKKYINDNLSIILSYFGVNYSVSDKTFKNFYKNILATYYFHPEVIKQKSDIERETKLHKSGINLAKNLHYLKELDKKNNTNNFERISNSLIGIVEEIDELDVVKVADKYIIIFKEKNIEISTDRVSDGTINFLSTIIALNQFYNENVMLAFEEPERHLHLKAVNYLLDEFRNHEKQILITTHSTEIMKNAKIEEIIFMYRDSYGETQAIRANKIKDLKGKLKRLGYKKDLSISELIDENILGDLDGYQ